MVKRKRDFVIRAKSVWDCLEIAWTKQYELGYADGFRDGVRHKVKQ